VRPAVAAQVAVEVAVSVVAGPRVRMAQKELLVWGQGWVWLSARALALALGQVWA